MKIKETFISFTDEGKYAYFLLLDSNGGFKEVDELVNLIVHFSRIVIAGDEPMIQKDEVLKLVKKLIKINPSVMIEIHTNGTTMPSGLGAIKNIEFFVNLQMKKSGITYEQRVIPKIVNWLAMMNTRFVFTVKDKDDVDEVGMIVGDNAIRKYQVFLRYDGHPEEEELMFLVLIAKSYEYNFSIDWREIFWPEVGKHE